MYDCPDDIRNWAVIFNVPYLPLNEQATQCRTRYVAQNKQRKNKITLNVIVLLNAAVKT